MAVGVPAALALRAAEALEAVAHDIAGHSQAPDLIEAEHTAQWADAQKLRRILRQDRAIKKPRRKDPPY